MPNFTILGPARRVGLFLAICIGVLFSASTVHGKVSAGTSAGAEAAVRAYQEVALKNYIGAVEDFRKALAEDPSNTAWRKDLGFACLAAGLPQDAASEFAKVYSEHPEELAIALQLGYLSQQLHRDEDAGKYFEQVSHSMDAALAIRATNALVNLRASQLRDRKQHGYELLSQHQSKEAIKDFEAIHIDDPSDVNATLQLGYLYAATGRFSEAEEMFTLVDNDEDPRIVAQANAGLDEVHRDTRPWFGSFYAAPFYQSRFSNEINPSNAKVGLNVNPYFQPYIGVRFNRDVRSQAGTLPQIFSDNTITFSVGVQSNIPHVGVMVYAEAGTAVNLIGERPLAASDYRAGAVWYRSWGAGLFAAANGGHPISMTGSAYADVGYYTRYVHNVIGDVQLREGINLPTGHALPMQLLAAINLIRDCNGNFYNNVVEVGSVLRVAPFRRVPGLSFEAQYMRGFYDNHDPTNPYGPRYGDFRIFLIWAKTF